MLPNLPLSWTISQTKKECFAQISLSTKKSMWLSNAKLNSEYNFIKLIQSQIGKDYSIFLRGCNKQQIAQLEKIGFVSMLAGKEAILDLSGNYFERKSIKKLVKRGLRHGTVHEVQFTEQNRIKVNKFKKKCVHGSEPELKYLFITEFTDESRLFVLEQKKEWLALIVVTENSEDKFHTELLLRKKHAPVGVMEALICETFRILQNSTKKFFSLGEVPLILEEESLINIKQKLIYKLGKTIGHFYNYNGLYKFKNKFNPIWQNVYIAGYQKIKMLDLAVLTFKTQLVKLALYKLFLSNR